MDTNDNNDTHDKGAAMFKGSHTLGSNEKDHLLAFFFHHMPMEQRRKLIREMPIYYAKSLGMDPQVVLNIASGHSHENPDD